ncbi:MAG: hypothetical protein HUU20_08800 [Pirellulales bacterium]|nr:hypothetical protein [Pirellulales bacterium]
MKLLARHHGTASALPRLPATAVLSNRFFTFLDSEGRSPSRRRGLLEEFLVGELPNKVAQYFLGQRFGLLLSFLGDCHEIGPESFAYLVFRHWLFPLTTSSNGEVDPCIARALGGVAQALPMSITDHLRFATSGG